MRIDKHPEYKRYQEDQVRVEACHQVVAAWRATAAPIVGPDGKTWTFEQAQSFVHDLVRFFQTYNQVLWEQFSYCRQCCGGCCVVGASHITVFDGLATALLDQPFPSQLEQLQITARDCIYLTAQGCSWPSSWRPLKCASFYCLGSGDWQLDAADERYQAITEALVQVLEEHLPEWLQRAGTRMGKSLRSRLADPIGFAQALNRALEEAFVLPLAAHFPDLQQVVNVQDAWRSAEVDADAGTGLEEIRDFIVRAAETAWGLLAEEQSEAAYSLEQFLTDLEELEWILQNQPHNQVPLLTALYRRYELIPDQDDEMTALWREMSEHLAKLLRFRQEAERSRSGRNLIRIEDIDPPVV